MSDTEDSIAVDTPSEENSFQVNTLSAAELEQLRKNKEMVKAGSIFTLILLVLFGFIVLFGLLSRKSFQNGARAYVEQVFKLNDVVYVPGEADVIGNSFSYSCCSFTVKGSENLHAVLIRMNTLYGPQLAVFLYNSISRECDFIGFADVKGKASGGLYENTAKAQLLYYKEKIPSILQMEFQGGESK